MEKRANTGRKICMLTSVHSPYDARIFHKEAQSLNGHGYSVVIVAPHGCNETVDGVRVRAIAPARNRIERLLRTTWQVLKAGLQEEADVYHLQDPELVPIGFLLKLMGKKVLYDVHEDLPVDTLTKDYIPLSLRRLTAMVANVIEKLLSRSFDGVIPATDDIARKFSKHRNVVPVRNFPRLSHLLRVNTNGKPRAGFRCIYFGAMDHLRGIRNIVQAMDRLKDLEDLELVLYGNFVPAEFEQEVRALPGFEKTHYGGWVDYRVLPDALSEADAGLVCFRPFEAHLMALPHKLFECMAAGKPLIASRFPLWQQIVEGNRAGLCVDPESPDEIASSIRILYENRTLAREMGENARKTAIERYNWEKEEASLLALYERILTVPSEAVARPQVVNEGTLPLLSVVIPCRNEEPFIAKCLESILRSDYPQEKLEILVVDGMSEDQTREIAGQFAVRFPSIRLLENTKRMTAAALNVGIRNAKGELILKMDAHSTYDSSYIHECVQNLQKLNADCAGGILKIRPRNDTLIGEAIACSMSHLFGAGDAHFRVGSREPRWVDAVAFGCYKREIFDRIGLFDESVERRWSEDFDFNLRLRKAGGRILLVPTAVCHYYARSDFRAFCRHIFDNGFLVTYPLIRGQRLFAWRHLIPLLFVSSLVFLGVLSVPFALPRILLSVVLSAYGLLAVFSSAQVALQRRQARLFPAVLLAFVTLHISHGLGAVWGLLKVPFSRSFWAGLLMGSRESQPSEKNLTEQGSRGTGSEGGIRHDEAGL